MSTIFLKKIILPIMIIGATMSMCACNKVDDIDPNNKTSSSIGTTNLEKGKEQNDNISKGSDSLQIEDGLEGESNNLRYFQELIKLGSYSEIIRLGGEQRDPKDVIIKEEKMTLPEGKVVTIIGWTPGRMRSFINVGEEKVKELISEIEKSKIIDPQSVDWNFQDSLEASIELLVVNTSAEYVSVGLNLDSKNNHMFGINYEDTEKQVSNMCIKSEKLTGMIKELTQWKYVSKDALKDIVRAKYKDISYDKSKEFELTKEEIKVLVDAISDSTKKPLEYGLPRNILIEAEMSNGEIINMIWCEGADGMGIEGVHYQLNDRKKTNDLNAILTKYSTTPK